MRNVRIGACFLLAAATVAWTRPQPQQPNAPSEGTSVPEKKNAGPPAAAGRLINPESVAARLMLATPEQRQRALERFPAARREQIQKQLAWFDSLPKTQQELQIRRLERFAALPPDKQVIVRRQMEVFNQLPPARKQAIRRALLLLQSLPDAERTARMNSRAFRSRFSPEEQRIIADLSEAWLPPM
jgi:hypothetical protein